MGQTALWLWTRQTRGRRVLPKHSGGTGPGWDFSSKGGEMAKRQGDGSQVTPRWGRGENRPLWLIARPPDPQGRGPHAPGSRSPGATG